MKSTRTNLPNPPTHSRLGAIVVVAAVAIVLLLAMAMISVDVSYMQLTRTELQVASDAAAKAGSEALLRTEDPARAIQAAIDVAARNRVAGEPLILTSAEIELGSSQLQSNGSWEFTAGSQPYNSVRVNSLLADSNANGAVPYFLASFFGHKSFSPSTTATAANMEQDLYLVIDRSHSMCFDLSGVDWVYPSEVPKSPHPICYPPHPTKSRWGVLTESVKTFAAIAQKSDPPPRIGLVTWGSDIGTSSAEYYYTKQTAKAVEHDLGFTRNFGDIVSAVSGRGQNVMLGGTNMSAGMDAGIVELLNSRKLVRRTMILMTDGQWNAGGNPLDAAARAKAAGITIHTITFLPKAEQTTMSEIATLTGGKHYHADNAAELQAAFKELARTLPVVLTK